MKETKQIFSCKKCKQILDINQHELNGFCKVCCKKVDENDLGFTKDRELDKVELIADSYCYTDVGCLLHL